ncbi:MAG: hypothetical protein ACK5CA_03810 [Cyanobacteriota bacterium]|jgi:hypothetical protein
MSKPKKNFYNNPKMPQPNQESKPLIQTAFSSEEVERWKPYDLDYYAQKLVLENRDKKNVLNESHKMRMTVAYGLERFWGEHLRYLNQSKKEGDESQNKGKYWKSVWDQLAKILKQGQIDLPNDPIGSSIQIRRGYEQEDKKAKELEETSQIQKMAEDLWKMPLPEQRIALMVLSQFCDSLVWWTQRYKKKSSSSESEED